MFLLVRQSLSSARGFREDETLRDRTFLSPKRITELLKTSTYFRNFYEQEVQQWTLWSLL